MADVQDVEKNNHTNNSVANSNEHLKAPSQNGKPEEVEMDSMPENTKLDLEDSTLLPPAFPIVMEPVDKSSRKASWVSARKHSEPLGLLTNADNYYDDDDWVSDGDEDKDKPKEPMGILALVVKRVQTVVISIVKAVNHLTRGHLLAIIFLVGYIAYFILAMRYELGEEPSIRLLVCTIAGVLIWIRKYVYRLCTAIFVKLNGGPVLSPRALRIIGIFRVLVQWFFYLALAVVMIYVIIDQGRKSTTNLRSLPGLAVFLIVCLLFSTEPGNINWHTIYWSIGLQFLCALFVLRWEVGMDVILWIQDRLDKFLSYSREGSKFVFGEKYTDHFMIFGAFPTMIFYNAMISVLYYFGGVQFIIRAIGSFLSLVLDASPIESMSVAMSIFMEGSITVLSLQPYLGRLTRSQLFLVLTSILSSLGGAYMTMLASFGVSLSYIIPGMLISAPATFAVCKLMVPDSKITKTKDSEFDWDAGNAERKQKYSGVLDILQDGAMSVVPMLVNMTATLFVFVCIIYWGNSTLEWLGDRVGIEDLSIELIFSYALFPVSLAMGIEWDDCRRIAMLLGYRIGSNNMIAFLKLMELKVNKAQYMQYMTVTNFTGPVSTHNDDITLELWNTTLKYGFISDRSEAIVTYSLCGFSSFVAVSIMIGVLFTVLPRRRAWLGRVAWASLIAGNIANCMTGCFAALFY